MNHAIRDLILRPWFPASTTTIMMMIRIWQIMVPNDLGQAREVHARTWLCVLVLATMDTIVQRWWWVEGKGMTGGLETWHAWDRGMPKNWKEHADGGRRWWQSHFGIMQGDDHVAIASKWFFIKIMKNIARYMISTFFIMQHYGDQFIQVLRRVLRELLQANQLQQPDVRVIIGLQMQALCEG